MLFVVGPKKPQNLDVFLQFLVDDMKLLWEGVLAQDSSIQTDTGGDSGFTLRGMIMWTITDWPGLGAVSHFKCSGKGACHRCGPQMQGRRSKDLGTYKYHEARKYLPLTDPRRRDVTTYGFIERNGPPMPPSQVEWRRLASLVERGLKTGRQTGIHGWSVFYQLPYWEVSVDVFCKKYNV